ncbi:GNAT family N-acetyltransferase [Paenirhodobacter populi]|uniref:L-ornithine N(alpha)-acyltransferase n=1 Tax=Paenirhodobacter populi TaxID=2306993 RepID=A0A443JQ36_9RHOB|nr:GNAT family N-acyltransferase [Sinirhodobacter populi]RWR08677.1 GNAT family N-acetyltransferase [Sinirhodobacter populi]RWR12790.1 GNAT family N-acetyltransferase [Sinirhodobacter populi]RWR22604.1 GNAT family N-acetyltransferase [Sinirhodobacter populi]RWR29942.1 GNAT family N-acetyltransferase [Sinirhodobacter populi]
MFALARGRYAARFAKDEADLRAAQALRWRSFIGRCDDAAAAGRRDADAFDGICQHVLVEEVATGRLVCCYRILPLRDGGDIGRSYSAQYYELSALRGYGGRMVEMGRFCLDPEAHDPDILRVAWGAMTRYVDEKGVELLFGCSSFSGTAWQRYADAFALLADRHLAPPRWLPRIKAPRVVRYVRALAGRAGDPQKAMREMPPLLRSYLLMGGWVSDHAVIDPDLNTLHVFTGLEIRAIPPARARALRLVAG